MWVAFLGGDLDAHVLAAELLDHHAVAGQLLLDQVRAGRRQVDLVDRDHDRDPAALAWSMARSSAA